MWLYEVRLDCEHHFRFRFQFACARPMSKSRCGDILHPCELFGQCYAKDGLESFERYLNVHHSQEFCMYLLKDLEESFSSCCGK